MTVMERSMTLPVARHDSGVYAIVIPTTPGEGESHSGVEVSQRTLDLIIQEASKLPALQFERRNYWGPSAPEWEVVEQRQTEILRKAFVASQQDYQVGLELAVFAIFRFKHKFKSVQWLARELDKHRAQTSRRLIIFVKKCGYAHNPYYSGPRIT